MSSHWPGGRTSAGRRWRGRGGAAAPGIAGFEGRVLELQGIDAVVAARTQRTVGIGRGRDLPVLPGEPGLRRREIQVRADIVSAEVEFAGIDDFARLDLKRRRA